MRPGHPGRHAACCAPLTRRLSVTFDSLPVAVFGRSSRKTTSSGSHQRASVGSTCATSASAVSPDPARRTTQATGRSTHRGCGRATTATSTTSGWLASADSSSAEGIHSPPDLMRSFIRSTIRIVPCASTVARSPVRSHPSSAKESGDSTPRYSPATQGPATWSSPVLSPSHGSTAPDSTSTMRTDTSGSGCPCADSAARRSSSPRPAWCGRGPPIAPTGLTSVIPHECVTGTPAACS